ncbi:MAG: hypothetical protein AAB354_11130 [candidate division KSB1 bacterium]
MAQRKQTNRRKAKHKKPPPVKTATDILLQRVHKNGVFHDHVIMVQTPGVVKLSAVLLEYAKPYMELSDDPESKRTALRAAIVAWNLALTPRLATDDALNEIMTKALGRIPETHKAAYYRRELRDMIARKNSLFAHDDRLVLDYEITFVNGELRLAVVSKPLHEFAKE